MPEIFYCRFYKTNQLNFYSYHKNFAKFAHYKQY
jgi:hypothetical protein